MTRRSPCLRTVIRVSLVISLMWIAVPAKAEGPTIRERLASDPMFQRCVGWMLDGRQGAFLEDVCLADFDIPPPSVLLCAKQVRTGFLSRRDREGCAMLFDEQAKRARAGFLR
jgi:hypothetical protein